LADTPDVPDHVVDFIGGQKTLTLATGGSGGAPHATTLVYVNDGPSLYIWLRSSSDTARQLGDGAEVGFAIDEYSDDYRQTKGVQGSGRAEPVDGEEMARVGDLFGTKYPDLRPGATSAASFYRISPSELHYIDNTRGDGEPDPDEFRRESFGA
jgi:nitroimidazol reductase NimA-like FMN-containing flavoprotein (pyridoxamine 5'-phosphate oxidase superfamily)